MVVLHSNEDDGMSVRVLDIKKADNGDISVRPWFDELKTGLTDMFCVARLDKKNFPAAATIVRTEKGYGKAILWQFADNNQIKILYVKEKEVVSYQHLAPDSIPPHLIPIKDPVPVKNGEPIGAVGLRHAQLL